MNKSKIGMIFIGVVILAIIVTGIVMVVLKGFNYGIMYSKTQRMNIYIDVEFDIDEIKEIAKEVLGENVKVQLGNQFGTVASIITPEISDEQENNIIEKIQEKYETEISSDDDVIMVNVPEANILDMISIYVVPMTIIFVISVIYFAIRFREYGAVKSILMPIISVIAVLGLFVSAYSIIRIPVNEIFTIAGSLIFILTLLVIMFVLKKEKKLIRNQTEEHI
jgi:preprotein translocase subunit SecF